MTPEELEKEQCWPLGRTPKEYTIKAFMSYKERSEKCIHIKVVSAKKILKQTPLYLDPFIFCNFPVSFGLTSYIAV